MTTQTDDESVWKKQKNEWGTDLKMALTEMSPRTEYLQPHPELTANIIPSIPYLASESGWSQVVHFFQ